MSDQLELFAKEINHRWGLVQKLGAKADEHRIAAALRVAEARAAIDGEGGDWRKWCEENLTVGERETQRLLVIGQSDNPEKAVADQREYNREQQRQHRERKREAPTYVSREKPREPLRQALDLLPKLNAEEKRAVAEFAGHDAQKALPVPAKTLSARERLIASIEAVDDDTLADVLIRTFWHRIGDVLARKLQDAQRPSISDSRTGFDASAGTPGTPAGHEGRHEDGAGHADEAAPVDGAGSPAPENSERREGDATPSATPTPTSSPAGERGTAATDPYADVPDIPAQFKRTA